MGLGVLEARDEHVPGTAFVYDNDSQAEGSNPDNESQPEETKAGRIQIKYDLSGKTPIILVPQPSDDPNDPLNWPLWRRDIILTILCLISVLASTLSPLLAANSFELVFYYETDFTSIALLTGYHLLGVGVSGVLFVATARVWGKRHLFLLGTILIIISSAWGGASGYNYTSLLWARIIQGVGLAPFEALVNASVGDLYFVHQRGARMAASNMALFGGAFFTPILVGKITDSLGWQWSFYFVAIFTGMIFPLVFFFVPETAFRRKDSLNTDYSGGVGSDAGASGSESASPEATQVPEPIPEKVSYWRTLLPFNGRKTDENVFKLIFRPFPLFFHPAIFWACLTQGTLIGWTVMIGVVLAAVFFGPPLWFTEVQTGYMYTGPFVGAVLGFILAGVLSDWSTKLMIRRNKGVYEPEFRIVLVAAQLVTGCAGLYGFGYASAYVQPGGFFLPDFCFGLEVMGMVIGAVASALYIVDAHREIAVEAFTCLLMFKNIFSYALTYQAFNWLQESSNTIRIFNIIASIQLGVCLLSIPMYIFGKRNRAFFHKYDILKMCHLS